MSDSEDMSMIRKRALSMGSGLFDANRNIDNGDRRSSFFSHGSSMDPTEATNINERRGSFSRLRSLASSFFETSQFKTEVVPKLLKIQEDRKLSTEGSTNDGIVMGAPHIPEEALNPRDPKFGQEFPHFVRMLKLARTPSIGGDNPSEIQAVIQQNKEQVDEFLTTFCSTGV